jgi:hypothetical protein
MAELKTKQNKASVEAFIKAIPDEKRRRDCLVILELFKKATKEEPSMWGDSIVGFGNYHYKYASGREGDWFLSGFSPRKQNMTLYSMMGFEKNADLMQKLGKYKTGKGCLYINKLEDIDLEILKKLIAAWMKG